MRISSAFWARTDASCAARAACCSSRNSGGRSRVYGDQAARACGQVEAIGYAADPERLRLDLAAYESRVGRSNRLSVILRPMAPDCDSAENLAQKLAIARDAGAVELGFYHYGFMRLESLDLIRSALELP